jgi:DNA-binding PadR family transcriptional regulator
MFGRFRPRPAEDGLAVAILKLLEEQMGTAPDVTQRLEQRFEGRLDIGAGEVYPLLQYLEDRGFIAQEALGTGKVYGVTEAGFAFLAEQAHKPREDRPEDFFRGRERGHDRGHPHGRGPWGHHHGHHGWGHHHEHHRQWVGLFHDAKHLLRDFKHEFRRQGLDPQRVERIREIMDRARREIHEVLRERDHGLA